MPTLGYDPQRIRELADRARRVADHLAALESADPLAADAVSVASTVASHIIDGWLPALVAVERSRALLDPIGLDGGEVPPTADGHLLAGIVDGFSEEERTYFQGFVDACAVSVAQDLWLYDAEPNYDTSLLPAQLATLDSTDDWDWLARLHLVEQYHQLAASGDVELQRDGDAYWVDPLTAEEYARVAADFLQQPGTLVKIDEYGVIRVYDPETNAFGSYNPCGTTKTFFKPDPAEHGQPTNLDYWNTQRGRPM